jgi:hypothetical protein
MLALTLGISAIVAVAIAEATGGGHRPGPPLIAGGRPAERGPEVVPFPRTPDVSAGAHIMFPALPRTEIRSVSVEGSASGRHRGVLQALPGGRGTAFVPDQPFSAGEHVTVSASLRSSAVGAASGGSKALKLHDAFTVARPATVITPARGGGFNAVPTRSFHSAPALHPPVIKTTADADKSSGDVFVDVRGDRQQGPMILDKNGGLVWFAPAENPQLTAFDVRVQHYRNQPVLTYWEGRLIPPSFRGDGVGVILDRHYHRVGTITAGDGYESDGLDEHEVTLTPQGTALVSVTAPVHADLSSVGGPRNGVVLDSIIQEIDIATGKVVWEWHALGHVPLTDSYLGKPERGKPYDYFHLNSIQVLPGGNLLVSSRSTWAVYSINQRTGRINWEVGGKHSSVRMGPGTSFAWQHHALLHRGGLLTVFDNGVGPRHLGPRKSEGQSRALAIRLSGRRATLVHAYQQKPPVIAGAQGSVQLLPNGNFLVGWGAVPEFSEYAPSGNKIWGGRFAARVQSYRVYRSSWHGRPSVPPAIAVRAGSNGALTVYASWNGATDVARWQLLAGPTRNNLSPLTSVPKGGFETAITANTSQRCLAVRALTESGRVLGTSHVVTR